MKTTKRTRSQKNATHARNRGVSSTAHVPLPLTTTFLHRRVAGGGGANRSLPPKQFSLQVAIKRPFFIGMDSDRSVTATSKLLESHFQGNNPMVMVVTQKYGSWTFLHGVNSGGGHVKTFARRVLVIQNVLTTVTPPAPIATVDDSHPLKSTCLCCLFEQHSVVSRTRLTWTSVRGQRWRHLDDLEALDEEETLLLGGGREPLPRQRLHQELLDPRQQLCEQKTKDTL